MYEGIEEINYDKVIDDQTVECLVPEFKLELDAINDQTIKSVVQNIMIDIIAANKVSKRMTDYAKRVFYNAQTLAGSRGYTSLAKDIIIAAALLHDLYSKKHPKMHIFMIRTNHQDQLRRLDPALAENICSIIEGHHGYESIVPKVASKEGTIEQILTDAVALAMSDKL